MEENKPAPDPALIAKMIEAANFIHKNSKRGPADHVWVADSTIKAFADAVGTTVEEAEEHLRRYCNGEIDTL